jgi:hypothetical protein
VKAVDEAGLQGRLQSPAHQFRYRFTDGDVPGFGVRLYFPKNIIVQRKCGSHALMMLQTGSDVNQARCRINTSHMMLLLAKALIGFTEVFGGRFSERGYDTSAGLRAVLIETIA